MFVKPEQGVFSVAAHILLELGKVHLHSHGLTIDDVPDAGLLRLAQILLVLFDCLLQLPLGVFDHDDHLFVAGAATLGAKTTASALATAGLTHGLASAMPAMPDFVDELECIFTFAAYVQPAVRRIA